MAASADSHPPGEGATEASTLADATLPREEVAGEKAPLTIPVDDIKLKPARREDTPLQMQAQALGGKPRTPAP